MRTAYAPDALEMTVTQQSWYPAVSPVGEAFEHSENERDVLRCVTNVVVGDDTACGATTVRRCGARSCNVQRCRAERRSSSGERVTAFDIFDKVDLFVWVQLQFLHNND
jgi:hypothetical protein